MTGMIFYDWALDPRCYAVRLALSMMKIPHRSIAVDMAQPLSLRPEAFRHGDRPPALLDDDGHLFSTTVILLRLCQVADDSETWPDPAGDFQNHDWLAFAERNLQGFTATRSEVMLGLTPNPVDLTPVRDTLRLMEDHMTARHFAGAFWFVSPCPTIIDIALFPIFALATDLAIEPGCYPALRHWARRVRGIPGFMAMPGVPEYY